MSGRSGVALVPALGPSNGTCRPVAGTASHDVISETGGAPRSGARVGVEGRFRAVYTLGPQSGAVLIEKRRYNP